MKNDAQLQILYKLGTHTKKFTFLGTDGTRRDIKGGT